MRKDVDKVKSTSSIDLTQRKQATTGGGLSNVEELEERGSDGEESPMEGPQSTEPNVNQCPPVLWTALNNRTATIGTASRFLDESFEYPVIPFKNHSKIPRFLRQKCLDKLLELEITKCATVCSNSLSGADKRGAAERAVLQEHVLFQKCSTASSYKNAFIHEMKRLDIAWQKQQEDMVVISSEPDLTSGAAGNKLPNVKGPPTTPTPSAPLCSNEFQDLDNPSNAAPIASPSKKITGDLPTKKLDRTRRATISSPRAAVSRTLSGDFPTEERPLGGSPPLLTTIKPALRSPPKALPLAGKTRRLTMPGDKNTIPKAGSRSVTSARMEPVHARPVAKTALSNPELDKINRGFFGDALDLLGL
mmetsp:Transcript_6021/g.9849  ORF Transcript_6021/g.9849 Transcript_6021/m.9849 type:complete len:362 (-) Transcript_6021:451-1536(-)